MDSDKYSLEKKRPRPSYTPKNIRCAGCGAGLVQKDEHSEMIVCDYCGSHLDVSGAERSVLGKGPSNRPDFPLSVGDSFRYKGARFEIIARMAFIEDGDPNERTLQYLLYNPRMGTRWLDEYGGDYAISSDTHVMPVDDPFSKGRGDTLKTHDGREWVGEGNGVYSLIYVDGALPWIATVGDTLRYAEFSDAAGSGELYDAQSIGDENEYGIGKALSLDFVRKATRKPALGRAGGVDRKDPSRLPADAATTRRFYRRLLLIATVALLVNGLLAAYCMYRGKVVLSEVFRAEQLTEGIYTGRFVVGKANRVVKISATASPRLNNEWMALDVKLLKRDEMMIHEYENGIEYYHGSSGGESWSEGGQSRSLYLEIPAPDIYQLYIQAVSARGNTARSEKTDHGVVIKVREGVLKPHYFIGATAMSFVVLILIAAAYGKWKGEDEDDDDDDWD